MDEGISWGKKRIIHLGKVCSTSYVFSYPGTKISRHFLHRSVHNVRIERLWGDVTAQVGSSWADAFTDLELHHGLNINNENHIWLLHILFLPILNYYLHRGGIATEYRSEEGQIGHPKTFLALI
jgi:hypothetical protein